MSKKDIFTELTQIRLPMNPDNGRLILGFVKAIEDARANGDMDLAVKTAFTYGLEYGIALCRRGACCGQPVVRSAKEKRVVRVF